MAAAPVAQKQRTTFAVPASRALSRAEMATEK